MMTRKIAMISEHASPLALLGGVDSGGQNVYVGQVARHLASLGHRVDVFTRRDSEQLPEIVEWIDGVRIIHVPAGPPTWVRKEELFSHMDEFVAFMRDFCQRQRRPYDLAHANFWMSGYVAAELKRALSLPFVITFHALGRVRRIHQGEADGFPDCRFEVEDRVVAEADRIIAECPQDEEDLINLYNADPARITIIPCGFDPAEFSPINKTLARLTLGLPPNERILLQLGRMVPRKGVDNVIRGLARLIHEHAIAARLLIVGGESDQPDPAVTPEIGRLQQIAREEGVTEQVTFVGRVNREKLKYFYSASDLFISTPWYEPFGITPVEAMACGTPVIGANVGGIKYTVRDGETGFLVPPRDPGTLGRCLARLYEQPGLLAQLGRQSIQRANDFFTWRKVADMIADLYEELLVGGLPEPAGERDPLAIIDRGFDEVMMAFEQSRRLLRPTILEAAQSIADCFARGGKLLVCGNGGSAADAQHFAAEFVGRFKRAERVALPVLALTADSALLTAWSNDVGYEDLFARQVEAFGQPQDLLIGISTSGRSKNVVQAFKRAQEMGIRCLALLGRDGGELVELADLALVVPASDTPRIQEVHTLILHLVCELVEEQIVSANQTISGTAVFAA